MSIFRYDKSKIEDYLLNIESIVKKKTLYNKGEWCAYNHLFCAIAPVKNKGYCITAHPRIQRLRFR